MTKNFLDEYVAYAKEGTDAPEIYHQYLAFSILSTVCNRKIYHQFGHMRIYPNLWLILLGQSSNFRKSTSLYVAEDILNNYITVDITKESYIPSSNCRNYIYPNDFSKEALFTKLSEQSTGIFIYSEFSSLLNNLSRDYNVGTQELMTDLYDCPFKRERILKEKTYTIMNAFINIVSATTTDWLLKSAKEDQFKGGFLARFLYIPAEKTIDIPRPILPDEIKKIQLEKQLGQIVEFLSICKQSINIPLTEEAGQYYDNWYRANVAIKIQNDILTPIFARYKIYIIKLAMLYAINNFDLEIKKEYIEKAIMQIEKLSKTLHKLFDMEMGWTWQEKSTKKILKIISHEKKIKHSDLLWRSHLNRTHFNDSINTLLESNKIMKTCEKPDKGRPVLFYLILEDDANIDNESMEDIINSPEPEEVDKKTYAF